jgi:hypothetical protein
MGQTTEGDGWRGGEHVLCFSYTPHRIQYYDMIFDDVRQFAGVVMMTECTSLD